LRLFRFGGDGTVMTFPISVGREGWDTPTGVTQIVQKRKDPTWTVPASIRAQDPKLPAVVPAGPDNPLGQYALSLGWPGYLIHGTNAPSSIGKPASHGCMRMYPEDIESLFGAVEVGDTVTVIDTPITLGQSGGKLYLQVTPTRDQAKEIAAYRPVFPLTAADAPVMDLMTQVSALKASGAEIDDKAVEDAIARHDGMPVVIGTAPQENNTAPDSVNHI
jgi:L,D-transpeptidase ErfK/SrfK